MLTDIPEMLLIAGAAISLITAIACETYLFIKHGFWHWLYTFFIWPYVLLQSYLGGAKMRAVSIFHLVGLCLLLIGFATSG